jgi:GR25 family glycosyltransferase involved in LPS biosynthesis
MSEETVGGGDEEQSLGTATSARMSGFFDQICCINLKRRPDRWENMNARMQAILGPRGAFLYQALERFDAVDGVSVDASQWEATCLPFWDASNNARWDRHIVPPYEKKMTAGEIGCALSHVELWKKLSQHPNGSNATMLILEDDVVFYPGKGDSKPGFVEALSSLIDTVPPDWDIIYLGFCHCGPRKSVVESPPSSAEGVPIQLFRPTYGFYTHAYAIKQSAASRLLQELPISAPLDVWLADNDWFGLNVYVSAVPSPNGGLKGNKGVSMIAQRRLDSDIVHSAHHNS